MVVVVVVDFGSFSERQAGLPNELLIGHMSFVNRFRTSNVNRNCFLSDAILY